MTDSDRLLATGVPITLSDGRTPRLRYGMRGLKALEDEFGSINNAIDLVNGEVAGKVFTPLVKLLAAGLIQEELDEDALLDLLVPAWLDEYSTALQAAFEEAFPSASPGKGEAAQNGSTGRSGTPSPQPGSGEPTNSSGE